MKPVVFIHTNNQQMLAAQVSAHSLKSRSKNPDLFEVRFLELEETPHLLKRENQQFTWWEGDGPCRWQRRELQSFAPLRRLVPELMGFQGRALVIDPDIFAIGDVGELLSRDMEGKSICCRQKAECRDGRTLYSSAVMLLDCSRLTDWQWYQDIDHLFSGQLKLGPWLALWDQPPESIGLLEEEWNHHDTLTEHTKLLHNTEISTQPWKTGLPADYHQYAPVKLSPQQRLKQYLRSLFANQAETQVLYKRHPDPQQERFFFSLLKECLEQGSITKNFVRIAMQKNYLRKDAFEIMKELSPEQVSFARI